LLIRDEGDEADADIAAMAPDADATLDAMVDANANLDAKVRVLLPTSTVGTVRFLAEVVLQLP
jgi:hypothetical protein